MELIIKENIIKDNVKGKANFLQILLISKNKKCIKESLKIMNLTEKENINETMVENTKEIELMGVWRAKVNFILVTERNILELSKRIKKKAMVKCIL